METGATGGSFFEFDTEECEQEFDDGEQNLDDEAVDMVRAWDRNALLDEIREERQKIERDRANKEIEYYDGVRSFQDIASEMQPIGEGLVLIKVIEPNPDGELINGSHTILFDRVGYIQYQAEPFESSIVEGKPTKLNMAEGPAVCGLLLGLTHLRDGERADIMIKPSMGFGYLGSPPLIPGDATLLYHVKIYKIWNTSELCGILQYEKDNYIQFPIEEKLKLVEEHKQLANKYLIDDQPKDALVMYKAAIKCLEEIPLEKLSSNQPAFKMMVTLLQNASIVMNRLRMHKSATKAAKRALFMDPTNVKAYYQLIKARICLDDFSGALNWIEKADRYFPNNKSFDDLRLQVDTHNRDVVEERDKLMRRMSKAII